MPLAMLDPVALAAAMIRCRSVTPADGGTLAELERALGPLGFTCTRLTFGEGADAVHNLFARRGTGRPHFCYAGHTDVVPPGDEDSWSVGPFTGEVKDGFLYGRGASDMKGSIACFAAAVARFLGDGGGVRGSISLLITGDEEGPAHNGTVKVLEWMKTNGHIPDVCLVGEPTNPSRLGEMIKVGRRGSMTGRMVVRGVQGHVAYPHRAKNPIPQMVKLLAALTAHPLDRGSERFEPSNLEVTTVDVGNPANNVIPAEVRATFNIRFNDLHTSTTLARWIKQTLDAAGGGYELKIEVSGESFLTPAGPFTDLLQSAVKEVLDVAPELSTSGGTSDARFIRNYCPVAEFGLVGETMHKVDERVAVNDCERLTAVYTTVLRRYFAA